MSEQNSLKEAASVDIVRRCYTHASRGEWDQANALVADDFKLHEPASLAYGGVWTGKDAMQRLNGAVMSYWGQPELQLVDLIGNEQRCVVLLRFSMTSKATGKRFTQDVVEVLRVENGLIAELRIHYFDTAELALDTGSITRLTAAK